jgi:hypothetical protein
MAHCIYNRGTWKVLKQHGNECIYPTERAAKGQFTKLKNAGKITEATHALEDYAEYQKKIPMVKTYNMLNREAGEFDIRADLKGTCCDPATETYHSM